MGTRNPHADDIRPVDVRCKVCGHEWRTRAAYPQCSNPQSTEIDCGQSSDWEYVNTEHVPEELEGTEVDPRANETEESDDEEPQQTEPEDEEPEEPEEPEDEESELFLEVDGPESPAKPEDSTMVTPEEYSKFHGEEPKPEPESEETTEAVSQGDKSGFGIPFPTEFILPLVVVAVLVVAFLYIRRSGAVTFERPPKSSEIQVDEEPETTEEPAPSIDNHQKVQPRKGGEIPLME